MKTAVFFVLFLFFLSLVPGAGQAAMTVGFLVPASGLGDGSFNDMTYSGIIEAKTRHNFPLVREHCQGGAETDRQEALDKLIQRGAQIIVVNGWPYRNLVKSYARQYPERIFLLNDFPMAGIPNVISTVFAQHEGAFLAGALAGWMTKTNKIGFIGGMEMPVIQAYQSGYRQGAHYANPEIQLVETMLAPAEDAFSGFASPSLGFGVASRMYNQDVDIIFGVAGLSNQGIIQAARRHDRFVIGSEADQDQIAPGSVLTSVMKRLDEATFSILDLLFRGEYIQGIQYFGLKEGGIALSPMTHTNKSIPTEILSRLSQVRSDIITGRIEVSDPLLQTAGENE
ncbi:MAG: BMP family protein [Desulfopila sp.]